MSTQRGMTKLSAVKGLAAWIGKGSGAIVVMVLRGGDHAFYVDPRCTPADAATAVELVLPEMIQTLKVEREATRAKESERRAKTLERQLRERR